jgi:hypothetical protein
MLHMQAIRSALLVTVAFSALASAPYFAFRDNSLDRQIKTQDQTIADLRAQIDRMNQLDQERVEEIKSLVQRQANLEQVISGIAKDLLNQARNGLTPSFYDRFDAAHPSSIETTSAIPHVGSAKPEATTNDTKVRLPARKQAPVIRRQTQEAPTQEAPTVAEKNPNPRPEMQNY